MKKSRLYLSFLWISAIGALTGCAGGGGFQDRATNDNELAESGWYKVDRYEVDDAMDESHSDALWILQRTDTRRPRAMILFAGSSGRAENRSAICSGANQGKKADQSYDGSFVCFRPTGDGAAPFERFTFALAASDYCADLRTKVSSPSTIMDPAACAENQLTDCYCYNVAHCKSNSPKDACEEDPPRVQINGVAEVLSPPGNGSGSGGRYP